MKSHMTKIWQIISSIRLFIYFTELETYLIFGDYGFFHSSN